MGGGGKVEELERCGRWRGGGLGLVAFFEDWVYNKVVINLLGGVSYG